MLQKLTYRFNYWKRRILLRGFGICPQCWSRVNHTVTGRPICPNCAR